MNEDREELMEVDGEKSSEETGESIRSPDVVFQIAGKSFSLSRHIANSIQQKIIPDLENRISDKSRQNPLRTPVIFAIIRLLKVLPSENMSVFLPKLLSRICETLKDSDQVARDSGRHTLCKVCFSFHSPSILFFGFPNSIQSSVVLFPQFSFRLLSRLVLPT